MKKKNASNIVILFLGLMFYFSGSWANTDATSSTTGDRPSLSSFEIDYKIYSDLSDEAEPRRYNHRLGAAYSYDLKKIWNAGMYANVDTGFRYYSIGKNIPNDNANPVFEDFRLSLSHAHKIGILDELHWAIGNSFPTGYESQIEGYKSISDGSISIFNHPFNNKFLIWNRIDGSVIYNTYDYSALSHDPAPLYEAGYSLGFGWTFNSHWSVGLKELLRTQNYVDGNSKFVSQSKVGLTFSMGNFKSQFSYNIGTYTENETPNLWFLDEYHHIVALEAAYVF